MKFTKLLILCLALSCNVFGQNNKFEVGVTAGPNLSILYGNRILNKNAQPKPGLASGLTFQYNLNKKFSLISNLYFERKGFQQKLESNILYKDSFLTKLHGSSYYHADYISTPILARLNFGNKIKFFVNAGPYFSYLSSWNESHHFNAPAIKDPAYNASHYYNYTEKFKRYDFGISAGAGFYLPIRQNFAITVEARNGVGLANISALPVIDNRSIKNLSCLFLFGLNYKFLKYN